MKTLTLPRYGAGARMYDVLSFERPVYRAGREAAVDLMGLRPGDSVLDLGCGTGLNFPHLRQRIGAGGTIVGLDASESMLAQARRKADELGSVELVHGDAGDIAMLLAGRTFDAVIASYTLSVIGPWQDAWAGARSLLRPGARAAVVDLAMPRGPGRVLAPAARFACFTGGVDLSRRPWTLIEHTLHDVSTQQHRFGHVVVSVGTVPTDHG